MPPAPSASTRLEFPQSRCRVGVARGDITPPIGIYHRMWGAATHDRSTGVHRPLTATALALAPSATPGLPSSDAPRLLLAVDHCLLWPSEMAMLLDAVSSGCGLPKEAITVFFSHTHAAGLMGLERSNLPGGELIEPYLRQLGERLGELARHALGSLQHATILYATGRCSLAANRDYYDAERGRYVCGFNPLGASDDTLLVAKIVSDDGPLLATVVNYACHPTTLAWENTLISPDYLGAMREVIEQATGAPCFFIQGASGDLGPREGFVGQTEVADRNGRPLGYAALAALESLPPPSMRYEYAGPVVSGATIGTWHYAPLDESRRAETTLWNSLRAITPLPYQANLPTAQSLEAERIQWQAQETQALACGDEAAARHARAMIERATRRLTRAASLPPGESYPYPLIAWRLGDAVWLAFDGEHYQALQLELRRRFPRHVLIIGTLANGSTVWYLPDAASYGKGLYQEEASVLARGSLEKVIDAATKAIESLLNEPASSSPLADSR